MISVDVTTNIKFDDLLTQFNIAGKEAIEMAIEEFGEDINTGETGEYKTPEDSGDLRDSMEILSNDSEINPEVVIGFTSGTGDNHEHSDYATSLESDNPYDNFYPESIKFLSRSIDFYSDYLLDMISDSLKYNLGL